MFIVAECIQNLQLFRTTVGPSLREHMAPLKYLKR